MKTLSCDIETYSSVNLAKSGLYKYAESPDFEILLFGYSVDGGPVQVIDLACGEKIPSEVISALTDKTVTKWAFNASFERVCISRYGKLLNAFDLVRTHKFGDEDEQQSMKDMLEFAVSLDAVKLQIAEEQRISASEDFAESDDWRTQLRYMPRSSVLENSVWNEMLILNNDPDFANFAYNEMANRVQVTGEVPWERPRDNVFWRDADTAQLKAIQSLLLTAIL